MLGKRKKNSVDVLIEVQWKFKVLAIISLKRRKINTDSMK